MVMAVSAENQNFNPNTCFTCHGSMVSLAWEGWVVAGLLLLQEELGKELYDKLRSDLGVSRWPSFGERRGGPVVGCVKISEVLQWLDSNVVPDQL